MRKFFPLKQFSGARKSSEGVDYSTKDDSRRNSTASQERKGSIEAFDEHSLYCEVSRRNSFSRHVGRQHWCPTCSDDSGTRCNTPPSCDENLSATEENDTVVDSSKRLLSLDGIRSSHSQEECMEKLTKSRSRSSNNPFNVDRYSNGSGKKGIEESASKPSSTPLSPLRSAGDLKSKSKGTSQLLSSIPKVPDTGRQRSSPTVQSFLNESMQSSCPSNEFLVRRKTSGLPPLDLQSGSIRLHRPISHTSRGGPSIMLQPRSYSFSDASSFRDQCFDGAERSSVKSVSCVNSEEDGTQKDVSSSASSESLHFKYPSARAVAERLAKAIRASSKSSSNNDKCSSSIAGDILSSNFRPVNETKFRLYEDSQTNKQKRHSSPCPSSNNRRHRDLSECSEITFENVMPHMSPNPRGGFDCIAESKNWKEQTAFLLHQENLSDGSSEKGSLREIHVDKCHGMESEESIKWQSWTTNRKDQCGQERQLLSKRLESFIRYFESSIEELQDKARSAEERAVNFELDSMAVDDFILKHDHLLSSKENFRKATAAKFLEIQHKIRELQEEKGSLALEVAAELRQRIAERDSAKRVMALMKTAVDLYIKASEKEQQVFTSGLETKLQTRQVENIGLRERIQKLEEEKAGLQNDLTLVTSQESVLGEKVKNFELLMEGHKKRVEEAEKTILHLRQASMYAQKQNKQAEEELQALKKMIKEKEEENLILRRSLSRLQQLGMDQEKKNVQIACQCTKKSPCNGEESKNLNTTQLQQELWRLSRAEKTLQGELQASRTEAGTLSYQMRSLEEKLKNMQENSCMMKCELAMESEADNNRLRSQNLALESENYRLAKELTTVLNNEKHLPVAFQTSDGRKLSIEDKVRPMFSGIDLKGVTVLGKSLFKKGVAEGRKKGFHASSIPVELQQCLDVSQSLHSGMEGAKLLNKMLDGEPFAVKSQPNSRKEASASCELNTNVRRTLKDKLENRTSQIGLEHVNENLEELRKDYRDQETGLELLRKNCSLKEELELLKEKYQALSQCQTVVQSENNLLQSLLNNMNIRVAQLEDKLREKEEKIKLLQEHKEENTLEISRLGTELGLVRKERDDMQKEAEDLGREALRMSAQVEVLRRKVNQLEEDVLLKEGQISILKGSYEACD